MADVDAPFVPSRRRWAGILSRVLAVVGLVTVVAGSGVALLKADDPDYLFRGQEGMAAGLALLVIASGLGLLPITKRADRFATGSTLRSVSLFVQLLVILAITVVVLGALTRLGILSEHTSLYAAGLPFAVALLGATTASAHLMALGRSERPDRTTGQRILAPIGLVAAGVLVILGLLVAVGDPAITDGLGLVPTDAAMVFLAAAAVLAMAGQAAQALPSAMEIFVAAESASLPGGRARNVVLPVVIAFSLLVVSLLLFLLFGVSVAGVFSQVTQSPWLIVVFVFIAVAAAGSVAAATRLARREEASAPLYRAYTDPRAKLERETLYLGLGAGFLLLAFGGATYFDATPFSTGTWIHFVSLAFMVGLGPYGFLVAREARRIQRLEERFPDFLREIASSHRGGLTLAESVTVSARGDYGPLTPEIKRMADQVAWNLPFTEALERFADRVQTPLVQRAVNLIVEADRSGGASTDVLLAAASDAREIKTLENERRINMSLYTIIIYITFFVFLGVAAVLYGQFVPHLVESSQAAQTAQGTIAGGQINGISTQTLKAEQFQLFYFLAAMVQALGDGIVAGMMGTGRAVLGMRHSFIMVVSTYVTFVILLR